MDQSLIDQLQSDNPAQRRQAIMALGRVGDRTALPWLATVYQHDPVPDLRQLAGRAGRAILRRAPEAAAADPTTSPPAASAATPPPKQAAYLLDAALDSHVREDHAVARQQLAQALQVYPAFAQDDRFCALASKIMDTEPDDAIQRLSDKAQHQAIARAAAKTRQQAKRSSTKWRPVRLALLIFSTVAIIIQVWWFITGGLLDQTIMLYKVWQARRDVQLLANGQEYYVFVPGGSSPTAGWGVLVALHGYGGAGEDMLKPELLEIAEDEKAILVAPSFDTYGGAARRSNEPLKRNLNEILDAVAEDYPVNGRGAVIYGFSQGGLFATDFLSGYSHRIVAIVADGAPGIVLPPVGTYLLPCHFVYGEHDELQDFTRDDAARLRALGYEVTFEIVPGAGHEMTSTGMNRVRARLRALR